MFTRLDQVFPAPPNSDPAHASVLGRRTRHLLKYIFPLQFGIASPFNPSSDSDKTFGRARPVNFTDREVDIKRLGKSKTPPRLKGDIEKLTTRMIGLVSKCKVKVLLERWCPSKVCNEVEHATSCVGLAEPGLGSSQIKHNKLNHSQRTTILVSTNEARLTRSLFAMAYSKWCAGFILG